MKTSNTCGFMLIELLVYLILIGFVSYLSFQLFIQTTQISAAITKENKILMQVLSARDFIERDIGCAKNWMLHWSVQENQMICATDQASIGWILKNNCLYRIQGDYNFKEKKWNKKSKTIVADSIDVFSCALNAHGQSVNAVVFELQSGAHRIKHHVYLNNRVIV